MHLLAIDWFFILEKFLLIGLIVSLSMVVAMYATYGERKVAAWLQDRIGPNRAGPFGILQPLADGGKLFFKEEIIPLISSKFLFILGPCLAMITALLTSAVIGPTWVSMCSKSRITSCSTPTSAAIASACLPAAVISATTASAAAWLCR